MMEPKEGYGLFDWFTHQLTTFLSSTQLNVFLGLLGGLAINIFSTDPNSESYIYSLYWMSVSVIVTIILLSFYTQLAVRDTEANSVNPIIRTRSAFQNVGVYYFGSWSEIIRPVYLVIVGLYLISVYVGVISFTAKSREVSQSKDDQATDGKTALIVRISQLRMDSTQNAFLVKVLRDSLSQQRLAKEQRRSGVVRKM